MTIETLIIDDSAVVRQVLTTTLNQANDINVYGSAADPIFAERLMEKQWPDVIVLDIEMPRVDGITFLKKIMTEKPTPIIICSSLAKQGSKLALSALSEGAIEVITKPQLGIKNFLQNNQHELCNTVRVAANAKLQKKVSFSQKQSTIPAFPDSNSSALPVINTSEKIIAIGTSTGGTQALEFIFSNLDKTVTGIVVVQHMPESFTSAFATRLNNLCELDVIEATSGTRILPGRALIAPGGAHLEITRSGSQYIAIVKKGPAVNRHCPSVDVLFKSVAKSAGKNATGIILTGMGRDGVNGLKMMKEQGAKTYAQNERSSVVFGMPKEAIEFGAADHVVDLKEIPELIISMNRQIDA